MEILGSQGWDLFQSVGGICLGDTGAPQRVTRVINRLTHALPSIPAEVAEGLQPVHFFTSLHVIPATSLTLICVHAYELAMVFHLILTLYHQ